MITTYISDSEFGLYSSVEDKELNDLLQEIRKEFGNIYYLQTIRYDNRTLWDRATGNWKKTGVVYSLYARLDFDTQVINFCQDHKWSINTTVQKSYIMTYFFGLLAGIQYTKNDRKTKG